MSAEHQPARTGGQEPREPISQSRADRNERSGWIAVRCIYRSVSTSDGAQLYEERVTLWRSTDPDVALRRAEEDAASYAQATDSEFVGLSQAFVLSDLPGDGAEVFSLMRASTLEPDAYVDHFFDSGEERTT